jgi:hypothetical protein
MFFMKVVMLRMRLAVAQVSRYHSWVIQFEPSPAPAYDCRLLVTQCTLVRYVDPESAVVARDALFKVEVTALCYLQAARCPYSVNWGTAHVACGWCILTVFLQQYLAHAIWFEEVGEIVLSHIHIPVPHD